MKTIRIKTIEGFEHPAVDILPDSALQKSGKPFFVPDFADRFICRTATAVQINRLGKNIGERFAHRYYDEIGLCLSIEAPELLDRLRQTGAPWALATAFDGSVITGNVFPKEEVMPGEGRATTTVDGNEAASFTLPEAAEIDRLIRMQIASFDTRVAYDYYCDAFEAALRALFAALPTSPKGLMSGENEGDFERDLVLASTAAVAYTLYIKASIAVAGGRPK